MLLPPRLGGVVCVKNRIFGKEVLLCTRMSSLSVQDSRTCSALYVRLCFAVCGDAYFDGGFGS